MKEATVFSVLQQLRKLSSSASFKWVPTHFEPSKNPSLQVPSTAFKKEHWNVNDEQASKDSWISMASISLGLMGNLPFPFYAPCPEMGWKNQGCRISTRFRVSKRLAGEGFVALRRRQFQMIAGKGSKLSSLKTTFSPFSSSWEKKLHSALTWPCDNVEGKSSSSSVSKCCNETFILL